MSLEAKAPPRVMLAQELAVGDILHLGNDGADDFTVLGIDNDPGDENTGPGMSVDIGEGRVFFRALEPVCATRAVEG